MGIENMVAARPNMEQILIEADDRAEYQEFCEKSEKTLADSMSFRMWAESVIHELDCEISEQESFAKDPEFADECDKVLSRIVPIRLYIAKQLEYLESKAGR